MRRIRFAFPVAVAFVCALPVAAFGQSEAENRATARAQGQQGQAAFDAKDYKKSEDAFRRADALYHAPTLSLGLARAQAAEGKFVEAWENYNRVILEGVTSSPAFANALTAAKAEIGAIEGRRSRVTIAVNGSDAARVAIDERPLKSEALGIALFVDPGPHTVTASADGYKTETRTFTVAEGKSETVSIALQRATALAPRVAAAAAATIPMGAATAATAEPPITGAPPAASLPSGPVEGPPSQPNRVPSFLAFGVAAAGLATGAIAGVVAVGKHSELKSACAGGTCDPSEQSNVNSYDAMGLVSTVGFVVAGVGAAAGVVLWLVAPKTSARPSSAAWVAPYLTLGSVGAVGRF